MWSPRQRPPPESPGEVVVAGTTPGRRGALSGPPPKSGAVLITTPVPMRTTALLPARRKLCPGSPYNSTLAKIFWVSRPLWKRPLQHVDDYTMPPRELLQGGSCSPCTPALPASTTPGPPRRGGHPHDALRTRRQPSAPPPQQSGPIAPPACACRPPGPAAQDSLYCCLSRTSCGHLGLGTCGHRKPVPRRRSVRRGALMLLRWVRVGRRVGAGPTACSPRCP